MYATETAVTTVPEGALAGIFAMMAAMWVVMLIVAVFMIVVMWKVFVKAGKPGWAAIIPIYNTIVMLEIAGRPIWWIILMFVPIANFVVGIIVCLDIAQKFGKSVVFAIFGLLLFPIVGWPMLAFGKSQYEGPVASAPTEAPAA